MAIHMKGGGMPQEIDVRRVGPEELIQRGLIARRYYLDGRTRVQIAEEFDLSRFKVARILEDAVASGMVEITVHAPESIDIDLSRALKDKFGLRMAFAVRTASDEQDELWDAVGRVTADLLSEIVTAADVLGVDCGRTLSRMATHIDAIAACDVVQLTGMAGRCYVRRPGPPHHRTRRGASVVDVRSARGLGGEHLRRTASQPRDQRNTQTSCFGDESSCLHWFVEPRALSGVRSLGAGGGREVRRQGSRC